jgi:hypothetical protein
MTNKILNISTDCYGNLSGVHFADYNNEIQKDISRVPNSNDFIVNRAC